MHLIAYNTKSFFAKKMELSQQIQQIPENKVKVSSYIAQCPIPKIVQNTTLYFLADILKWTPSQLLWEAAINAWRLFLHKYPPLSIVRYSFIQLKKLEQCRVHLFYITFLWLQRACWRFTACQFVFIYFIKCGTMWKIPPVTHSNGKQYM